MRDRASMLITAIDSTKAAFDSIEANLARTVVGVRKGGAEFGKMGESATAGAGVVDKSLSSMRDSLEKSIAGFAASKREMQRLGQASRDATASVAQAARELSQDPGSDALKQRLASLKSDAQAIKREFIAAQLATEGWRRTLTASGVNTRDLSGSVAALTNPLPPRPAPQPQKPKPPAERLDHARELLDVRPWHDIQQEIKQVQAAFGRLASSGRLSAGEIGQAFAHAQIRIAEIKSQTNGIVAHFATIKGSLAGLVASATGFTVAAREAISFESAMTGVRRVANTTAKETADLGEKVRQLAMSTGESATEIAGMVKAAASAGIAKEDLMQFTEQAIKAAVAFEMLPAEAGESLAKLQGIFKIPLNEIDAFSGAINMMADNAKTREKDIVETLVRGAGNAGQQFGLLRTQTVALATAILDMGVAPEIAGTAMRTLLDGLRHAIVDTGEAGAGLRALGIDAAEFGGKLSSDASGALTGFLARLAELDSLSRRKILEQIFGSGLDTSLIEQLTGNLGAVRKLMGMAAGDAGGFKKALEEVFSLKMGETQTELNRMWESIKALGDAFGQVLLPAIRLVTAMISAAAAALREFVQTFPLLSVSVVTFATLASGFAALRLVFGTLVALGGRLASALSGAFSAMVAPLGVAVSWVTRLVAGFGVLSAALLGWDVGNLLNRFAAVRQFGVLMVAGLVLGFEELRFRWEQFQALFTSDTLEKAAARHQQRVDEMGDIFAQMYDDAGKEAQAAGKKEVSADKQTATGIAAVRKDLADKKAQLAQLAVDREKAILEQGAKTEKDITERKIEDIKRSHEVMKKANDDAISDLKRYKEAAQKAFDEAAGARSSTADKVRALRRRDMDEAGQQRDIELEAAQKIKLAKQQTAIAAQAAQAGDTQGAERAAESAKRLADQASSLGESLKNTGAAVRIVQAAGKVSADASTQLGNANTKAAEEAQGKINNLGMAVSTLEASLSALEQKKITLQIDTNVEAVTQQVAALEARLAGLSGASPAAPAQPQAPATAALPKFKTGGFLPGYGGGDRILALLESGEFIMRKEAVRKFGLGFLGAINSGVLPRFQTGGLASVAQRVALSGAAGGSNDRVDLFLHFGDNGAPSRVTTPRDEARSLISRLGSLRFYGGSPA